MITNQESSVLEMTWLIGGLPGRSDGAVEYASGETEGQEQSQYRGSGWNFSQISILKLRKVRCPGRTGQRRWF
jgi:hypothetical protein